MESPNKNNTQLSISVKLQISAHLKSGSTRECFRTKSKHVVQRDFRATQKCSYLEKYLFAVNKIFIFVFSISNTLKKKKTILKLRVSWAVLCYNTLICFCALTIVFPTIMPHLYKQYCTITTPSQSPLSYIFMQLYSNL